MSACPRCGADLPLYANTCAACGARPGILPSNERDPQPGRPGRAGNRVVGLVRLGLLLVAGAAVALALLSNSELVGPRLAPVVGTLLQAGGLMLQAAAEQLARRSRIPLSGSAPDLGRLLVLLLVAGGLVWFLRTRTR
jgi:hypothetical protein